MVLLNKPEKIASSANTSKFPKFPNFPLFCRALHEKAHNRCRLWANLASGPHVEVAKTAGEAELLKVPIFREFGDLSKSRDRESARCGNFALQLWRYCETPEVRDFRESSGRRTLFGQHRARLHTKGARKKRANRRRTPERRRTSV